METRHKEFKPFDKVLFKDGDSKWQIDLYSYWDSDSENHITMSYGGGLEITDADILPFEGNEHLVGTTDEADEEVRLEKGEWVMALTENRNWVLSKYEEHNELPWGSIKVVYSNGNVVSLDEIVRFSDFNPNDMEETKMHILCVKNGRIVKYKND